MDAWVPLPTIPCTTHLPTPRDLPWYILVPRGVEWAWIGMEGIGYTSIGTPRYVGPLLGIYTQGRLPPVLGGI